MNGRKMIKIFQGVWLLQIRQEHVLRMSVESYISSNDEKIRKEEKNATHIIPGNKNILALVFLAHEQKEKKRNRSQVRSNGIHYVEHLLWPQEETSRLRVRNVRGGGWCTSQPLGSVDIELITFPLQALHGAIHPSNGPIIIPIVPLWSSRSNVEIPNTSLLRRDAYPNGRFWT